MLNYFVLLLLVFCLILKNRLFFLHFRLLKAKNKLLAGLSHGQEKSGNQEKSEKNLKK